MLLAIAGILLKNKIYKMTDYLNENEIIIINTTIEQWFLTVKRKMLNNQYSDKDLLLIEKEKNNLKNLFIDYIR